MEHGIPALVAKIEDAVGDDLQEIPAPSVVSTVALISLANPILGSDGVS